MENKSGIHPTEYNVLIKPKQLEEKTEGGIFIPETAQDKQKHAIVTGELVEVAASAFTDPTWKFQPEPGMTVMFERYAGNYVPGKDGKEYRITKDKDIVAVLDGDYIV